VSAKKTVQSDLEKVVNPVYKVEGILILSYLITKKAHSIRDELFSNVLDVKIA